MTTGSERRPRATLAAGRRAGAGCGASVSYIAPQVARSSAALRSGRIRPERRWRSSTCSVPPARTPSAGSERTVRPSPVGGRPAQQLLQAIGQRAAALEPRRAERRRCRRRPAAPPRAGGAPRRRRPRGRRPAPGAGRLDPSPPAPRAESPAGVADDRVEGVEHQLLLAGEEAVERGGRDAGGGGQLVDARSAVALGAQELDDGLVEPRPVGGRGLVARERVTTARQRLATRVGERRPSAAQRYATGRLRDRAGGAL